MVLENRAPSARLICTYRAALARAAFARVTLARMSDAVAVQMNGLGWELWSAMYRSMASSSSATLVKLSRLMRFSETAATHNVI